VGVEQDKVGDITREGKIMGDKAKNIGGEAEIQNSAVIRQLKTLSQQIDQIAPRNCYVR